ncbi:hypothetical protein [Brevundimonas sp.]|uniref:hypothetical protein n=1 Tax=Brevundimonas sp. TaxID=1871086 RepID=UPI0026035FD2|nr:hypothetical protein [Brevundimonas sp.]
MRIQDIQDEQVLGAALILLGLSLGGAAAATGLLAAAHMAQTGPMCGSTLGHCFRCVAAVALLLAALASTGAAAWLLKPRPALPAAV